MVKTTTHNSKQRFLVIVIKKETVNDLLQRVSYILSYLAAYQIMQPTHNTCEHSMQSRQTKQNKPIGISCCADCCTEAVEVAVSCTRISSNHKLKPCKDHLVCSPLNMSLALRDREISGVFPDDILKNYFAVYTADRDIPGAFPEDIWFAVHTGLCSRLSQHVYVRWEIPGVFPEDVFGGSQMLLKATKTDSRLLKGHPTCLLEIGRSLAFFRKTYFAVHKGNRDITGAFPDDICCCSSH